MNGLATVVLFSCEPGGAECLVPIYKLLAEKQGEFRTILTGYGHGETIYARYRVPYIRVQPILPGDTTLVDQYRASLVISSATSLPEVDMSERYLWQTAAKKKVPSIGFVDQWQNYAVRFSGPNGSQTLAFLPDYINCIDEIGRSEMLKAGFPASRLIEFGHPYLSAVPASYAELDREKLRKSLGVSGRKVVLFVGEPIRENYGSQRGYDQYRALEVLLQNAAAVRENLTVLVKPHPKDSPDGYQAVIRAFQDVDVRLLDRMVDPLECICVADVLFGMSSIMLIQAFILGKQVASLQPGMIISDPLVLTRHGLIPLFTDDGPIDVLNPGMGNHSKLRYEFDADKFLKFVRKLIGH